MKHLQRALSMILWAGLSSLALAQAAAAQTTFCIQPVGDQRCLARVTGGFSLAPFDGTPKTRARFVFDAEGKGRIAFGTECVSVQNPTQGSDPWASGTRLQAIPCFRLQAPSVTPNRSFWKKPENTLIKAPKAPQGPEKCLSIAGGTLGALRAVIMSCDDFGVTNWKLVPR